MNRSLVRVQQLRLEPKLLLVRRIASTAGQAPHHFEGGTMSGIIYM